MVYSSSAANKGDGGQTPSNLYGWSKYIAEKYGEKQVLLWRRSYETPPPKLDTNDKRHPIYDLKYNEFNNNELYLFNTKDFNDGSARSFIRKFLN